MSKLLSLAILLSATLSPLAAKNAVTDSLEVRKTIANNPAELLRSSLSGVRVSEIDGNPNGAVNVNIRGINTLRGDSQPLWIVDGVVIGSHFNQNLDAFYLKGGTDTGGNAIPDYSGMSYTAPIDNFRWLNLYDIESIEVIKDLSAAAIYGMQGANGVIIVKTKRSSASNRQITVRSHAGLDLPDAKGEAFSTGYRQKHGIGINGSVGGNSRYNISAFIDNNAGAIKNGKSTYGGLAVNFETMAHNIFKFGLNSYLSYGEANSASGSNYFGAPSTMLLSQYPAMFPNDKISSWIGSYDDTVFDYRSVNSAWFQIDFMPSLKLKMTGGVDYHNQSRFFWYGNGTSFGRNNSGASAILNNALLNYNFKGELKFDRHFAIKHHLMAELGLDLNGYLNTYNALCGTDFDLPFLRGKGLSSSGSKHAIHRFPRKYNESGAYLSVSYSFDAYAGINAVARFDKAFAFYKQPLFLPSVEAFVNIKKLLWKDSSILSSLDLKGGYGSAGRELVLPYSYMSYYIADVPSVQVGTEPYIDGLNRLISKEYNVGLQAGLLSDRFVVGLKYYDKTTFDNFKIYNYSKNLGGIYDRTKNPVVEDERTSSIENKGVEIDGDFEIISKKDFSWSVFANASFNSFSAQKIEEVEETPIIDIEKTLPKHYGGFGSTVRAKSLKFNVQFDAVGGFEIVNASRILASDSPSALIGEKGDYLRLSCLSATYDIKLKSKMIKGLSVDIAAHNLFTISEYSGWNPDANSFGVTTRTNGIDYGAFPMIRSFVVGLKLKL